MSGGNRCRHRASDSQLTINQYAVRQLAKITTQRRNVLLANDLSLYLPNVFQLADLSRAELAALEGTFASHKRLFLHYFQKFSVVSVCNYLELGFHHEHLMSLKQFGLFVGQVDAQYEDYPHSSLLSIFKFVTKRVMKTNGDAHHTPFALFAHILFLFCFDFHRRKDLALSPFRAFCVFLERMRATVRRPAAFENDYVLSAKTDGPLLTYLTDAVAANPNLKLPTGFARINKVIFAVGEEKGKADEPDIDFETRPHHQDESQPIAREQWDKENVKVVGGQGILRRGFVAEAEDRHPQQRGDPH